jgi:hypothetical protein
MIEEKFGAKLETILSQLDKMTELVKQQSQKCLSNQPAFIEALTEWIAVKSISFRSVTHPLFQEMIQHADPDFSVPVFNTLKHHIKRLVEVYRQLSVSTEKLLLCDGRRGKTIRPAFSGGLSVHGRTRSIRGLEGC